MIFLAVDVNIVETSECKQADLKDANYDMQRCTSATAARRFAHLQ